MTRTLRIRCRGVLVALFTAVGAVTLAACDDADQSGQQAPPPATQPTQ